MEKCPKCNVEFSKEKVSILGAIGLGVVGEISIWIVAAIIAAIFSITSLSTAYILAIAVLFVAVLSFYSNFKTNYCKNCGKYYSTKEISRN